MRIAVTGGIASGKSTLLHMLREWGASTASADAIARDALWNPDVQAQLMQRFSSDEPISPAALRGLMELDDVSRRAVNQIMHPVISNEMAASTATIFEVPLLLETCLHVAFDVIWVAFCSRETQTKRLIERYGGIDRMAPISWQLDSKVPLVFADSVICTEGGTRETAESLLQEAKRWDLPLVVS